MDAKRRQLDTIIGRVLLFITAKWDEIRRRIIQAMTNAGLTTTQSLDQLRTLVLSFEQSVIQAFVDSDLAANASAIDAVYDLLPPAVQVILGPTVTRVPPSGGGGSIISSDVSVLDFPIISEGARILEEKQVVTRQQFDLLEIDARQRAFTVARQSSIETIDRVRNLLLESITSGTSLSKFEGLLEDALITSPLGPAHLENVYRTNIQSAFHAAHHEMANDPIVSTVFPYQQYLAIHDGRVRDDHLSLETLGMSGTNVYRLDDPFWEVFMPPWDFNCRCGISLMTVEAAARAGVEEARQWERTGQAPADPEWRLDSIPFRPDPQWARGR